MMNAAMISPHSATGTKPATGECVKSHSQPATIELALGVANEAIAFQRRVADDPLAYERGIVLGAGSDCRGVAAGGLEFALRDLDLGLGFIATPFGL